VATNADRIRSMSDEELADFNGLGRCHKCAYKNECMNDTEWGYAHDCKTGQKLWLKQEVE